MKLARSDISSLDYDVEASRAVAPAFYRAPVPDRLPDGMKPMEFQYAGVEYLLARDHGILGDQPGLTKTAQSIMLSNAVGAKKTLVICPASLRLNWEREIWRWSTIPNVSTYPVLKSKDGVSIETDYLIVSYDLLRNPMIFAAIMDLRWDHLIVDEAHALKDPKGNQRTNLICAPDGLPSVVGRITLLSGTPSPNQPIELYNAIRLVNWRAIDNASLEDFRDFYYDIGGGMVRGPVFDPERQVWTNKVHWSDKVRNVPRNLDDLQFRLRKHCMVRRIKEQVLHELPPKTWHMFPLVADAAINRALRHEGWKEARKMYEMDPDAFEHGVPIDGAISTARRELGEAKVDKVLEYIEELLEEGVGKLVVAAWHRSVLETMHKALGKHGLVYMDGSTSTVGRQRAVDQFQQNSAIRVILGQMQTMGEGWTLTAAQDVVLAEPDWVPGRNDQMLDRCHRPGQKGTRVIGHVPVVPGTLDERIVSAAIRKDRNIHLALDHKAA